MNGMNKRTLLIVLFLILILPCITSFTGVKANTTKSKVTTQNHNPILFLHGWTKSMMDWVTMKEWFKADGWSDTALYAYNFDDPSSSSDDSSSVSPLDIFSTIFTATMVNV